MSQMIKVKTAELSGAALRYAIIVAVGGRLVGEHAPREGKDYQRVRFPDGYDDYGLWFESAHPAWAGTAGTRIWRPDVEWSQGGPLIDKFHTDLHFDGRAWWAQADTVKGNAIAVRHEHPLTAVCRAIVAAKLGDTVAVPAELLP